MASQSSLHIPITPGDTIADIIKRIIRADQDMKLPMEPGWEWGTIIIGLDGAIKRYNDAVLGSTGLLARAAVGEALWWIAGADEYLRTQISQMGSREYYSKLIQSEEGRIIAGLTYLRHRMGHQFALALAMKVHSEPAQFKVIREDGTIEENSVVASLTYHMQPYNECPKDGFYFTPLEHLPAPDPTMPERSNRDESYRDCISNNSVGEVLDKAAEALQKVLIFTRSEGKTEVKIIGHPLPAPGQF